MSEKKSQFIKINEATDSQYVPLFGDGVDRAISIPDFFSQIKDESFSPFIYPTIELLQAADLEVDVDNPTYCRCEETEYRLYKITNAAPGIDDIALTNGNTAEYQIEYRDTGFVTSVATSAAGYIPVFTDSTGQELDKSVVPTNTGKAFIQAPDGGTVAFPRKNADNTITMRSASQYFDDIKQNATHGAAGVIKTADGTSTLAQTATDEAITPANLATLKASSAEVVTGTDAVKYVTPETLQDKFESDGILTIATVADIATTSMQAGQIFDLVEYYAGTGKGGGQLLAYTSMDTPNNGTIFSTGTPGIRAKRINYNVIDPLMFGARNDGVTDCGAAINASIAAIASMSNPAWELSAGSWYTTVRINIDGPNGSTFNCIGEIVTNISSAAAVRIGNAATNRFFFNVTGSLKVRRTSIDTTTGSTGINIRNVVSSSITIGRVYGFYDGVYIGADQGNGGVSYNQIYLGSITDNLRSLNIVPTNPGYVNENNFYGGGFNHTSSFPAIATVHLWVQHDPVHGANNNRFFGPSFEDNSVLAVAAEINGTDNVILYPRLENVAALATYPIIFTANSSFNTLIRGNILNNTNIVDNGTANECQTVQTRAMIGASATDEVFLKIRSIVSGNAKLIGFYGSDDILYGWITGLAHAHLRNLNLTNLGNYANDAAAAADGVPLNGVYRNGSVLMIRVA